MLQMVLPRTLESIERLATESATVANSTLMRFNQLQDLLDEIIELSASTQSKNEAEIDHMKEQMLNSTLEQQCLKEQLQLIKQQYNQSKVSLDGARKKYAEAMAAVEAATSPDVILNYPPKPNLLEAVIGIVFNPIETIGCLMGKCGNPTVTIDNTKFENAMNLAQLAKEQLEEAERIHNEYFQLQLAEQNELAKTINQMAMINLTVLSTEEIVHLLLESVEQINSIKEQWARMIQFFSKLSVQAQSSQQVIVKDFVEVIQLAQQGNLLVDPFEREFFVELLIPAATTIEGGAHLLYTMATTYYAVSSEHMITQITGIGKLLTLQTDEARTIHLQETSNKTLATSMKITQLAQNRHAHYLQETGKRQAEYATYMTNLLAIELEATMG